ncbi:MAG TPA: MopE-related protein, partial [Chitinophagaceae bacterium]|nr:MopE-related protein [Chitinophagaceae bacterium]
IYRSDSLRNGDKVKVVISQSYACSPPTVTSNEITITVNSAGTPSVSILAYATNICPGQQAGFTATPVNGGATPSYQWKLNGNNVGTNYYTYQTSTLHNGDSIRVVMTSSLASVCQPTASSNSITMSVGQIVIPSVSISSTATTICTGQSVTFTATPVNGGAQPIFQWVKNGVLADVGVTYQASSLANGDSVYVILYNTTDCIPDTEIISNVIHITTQAVTPSVSIYASQTSICTDWLVKFYANPVNGGDAPIYQWKLNGNNVGTNSGIFQSTTLNDNDVVSVVMTSSLSCASGQSVESNAITITVGAVVTPSVSIEADNTTICSGTQVTFTARPTNGGNTPQYLWLVNGNDAGVNSDTYQSSTLANGDSIQVIMTSSLECAILSTALSNTIKMTVTQLITYYADKDRDGYGDAGDSVLACGPQAGSVTNESDCNDNDASIHPGATEICGNGIDDNCNGQIDENCIQDLPTLMTRTYPAKEGDAGLTALNIEVSLDKPAQLPVSVKYKTINEDAIAGTDYEFTSGTLTIPVGKTSGSLQVKIIGDLLRESNERFKINFSDAVNVLLPADPNSRVMIIDDDKGKPNSASPNKDVMTETPTFKIPTVARRNSVWMIPQIGNYENEVLIVNVQGQVVSRVINYKNQTTVGNVATGLYFYRMRITESSGQYKYYSGRLLITE